MTVKFHPPEDKRVMEMLLCGTPLARIAKECSLPDDEFALAVMTAEFQAKYEEFYASIEDDTVKESVSKQLDALTLREAITKAESLLKSPDDNTSLATFKMLLKKAGLLENEGVNIGAIIIDSEEAEKLKGMLTRVKEKYGAGEPKAAD